MLRSLTVSTLILGFALAFVQPHVAAARDRDDYRQHRRERERREHRHHRDRGYYDRWGHWHWY
jgi:hypothetical protein